MARDRRGAAPAHRHCRPDRERPGRGLPHLRRAGVHALFDRRLYLPRSWADDAARRAAAGIPQDTEFATKPALAAEMIGAALDAGVPAAWVTGDEAYGAHAG